MEVFDLVAALRDPCGRDYESERLDPDGHTYIYRYLAEKRVFLRATKPSGASAPVFRALSGADKVLLEVGSLSKAALQPSPGWSKTSRAAA